MCQGSEGSRHACEAITHSPAARGDQTAAKVIAVQAVPNGDSGAALSLGCKIQSSGMLRSHTGWENGCQGCVGDEVEGQLEEEREDQLEVSD